MATLKEQKARKDYKCSECEAKIKKGDTYLRFSISRFDKLEPRCLNCRPKPSEMTQSDFLSRVYGIGESLEKLDPTEDLEETVSGIISELEELRDETQDKHDNMPDQLQESGTGELLQNRVESIEEMISELEGIDIEVDEDAVKNEVEREEGESDDDYGSRVEDAVTGKKDEIIAELSNISYQGE